MSCWRKCYKTELCLQSVKHLEEDDEVTHPLGKGWLHQSTKLVSPSYTPERRETYIPSDLTTDDIPARRSEHIQDMLIYSPVWMLSPSSIYRTIPPQLTWDPGGCQPPTPSVLDKVERMFSEGRDALQKNLRMWLLQPCSPRCSGMFWTEKYQIKSTYILQ